MSAAPVSTTDRQRRNGTFAPSNAFSIVRKPITLRRVVLCISGKLGTTSIIKPEEVIFGHPSTGDDHEATRVHHADPYSRSGGRNWACGSTSARSDLAAADRSCDPTASARHRDGHSRGSVGATPC